MNYRKAILFSAPSGSGKTTIIKELMKCFDCFDFSISATSRAPRGEEVNGQDYYFLSKEEFMSRSTAIRHQKTKTTSSFSLSAVPTSAKAVVLPQLHAQQAKYMPPSQQNGWATHSIYTPL